MRVIRSIKTSLVDIDYYLWRKSPIYINLNIWKIIRQFWKVRKVFKMPCIKFYKLSNEDCLGSDYFLLEHNIDKFLYINCHSIGYKWKWDDIRFEHVPYIILSWRNKIRYVIGFETSLYDDRNNNYSRNNLLYYEGILTYLYVCKNDIIGTYDDNIWTTCNYEYTNIDGKPYVHHFTLFDSLTETAKNEILNHLNKKGNT